MKPQGQSMLDLNAHIKAASAVPTAAIDVAQSKLLKRLSLVSQTPTARPFARWWLAVGVSTCAVFAMVMLLPMLSTQGQAFAQVQARFWHFQSLWMQITTSVNQQTTQRTQVYVNAQGQVRTDVEQNLSTVVDPTRGQLMILLHEQKIAVQQRIASASVGQAASNDDWLAQLRAFKGKAKLLTKTKIIKGVEAQGWQLQINGQTCVLWATVNDGLPMQMQINTSTAVQVAIDFSFDTPLSANLFSLTIPPGYSLQAPDAD